jgi:glycogen synthase
MTQRVAIVTYGQTDHDSRIRRIVRTLAESGRAVHLLSPDRAPSMPGLSGHDQIPALSMTRVQFLASLAACFGGTLLRPVAPSIHRLLPSARATIALLRRLRPDIVHANDWVTLPAAIAGAGRATVIYDSHEDAVEEHAAAFWWRIGARPAIAAIEGQLIGRAAHVLTVGPGLAEALRSRYSRLAGVTVVRNLPDSAGPPVAQRPGQPLRLIYAGLMTKERRLDAMIEALARLPDGWTLIALGFGPARHALALRALAEKRGVASRITWRPPVPPEQLLEQLTEADIGIFLSDGQTRQQRLALPNKIFEYTAAGLAVATCGSDESNALLARHGHGIILPDAAPEKLADALVALGRSGIDRLRLKAAEARKDLIWSREKPALLAVYDSLSRP